MVVLIIIIVALLTVLAYAILFLLTKLIQSFRAEKFTADKKLRLTLLISAFAIAALTTYFFLFTSPATNYKTAYIEKEQQYYKLTVKGKRLYMVHDPISFQVRPGSSLPGFVSGERPRDYLALSLRNACSLST